VAVPSLVYEADYRSTAAILGLDGTGDHEITEVYIMDHGYKNNDPNNIRIDIEIEGDRISNGTPFMEKFFSDLGDVLDKNNGSDAVIHLRNCWAGYGDR
jgi:hypothetical protein